LWALNPKKLKATKAKTESQPLLFTSPTVIHHPQHLLHGALKQFGIASHIHRARVKLAGQVPGPDAWLAAGVDELTCPNSLYHFLC